MYGLNDLKRYLAVTDTTVECPVRDCCTKVKKQEKPFRKDKDFFCEKHRIYISPSTFEYFSVDENLLWKDPDDKDLLGRIRREKRESRMARDNSEDAVTWNVFRFLEKNNRLSEFCGVIASGPTVAARVIYWSYCQSAMGCLPGLKEAREEFGEEDRKGSEPDIVIVTDRTLFFVEAKLTAGNKTHPSGGPKLYTTGGNNWFLHVFKSDYNSIARDANKYELMRLWLMGTWLGEQLNLDFYLVNLVPASREKTIEEEFKPHILETERRKFNRLTWEQIYKQIKTGSISDGMTALILGYFEQKTIGYRNGELQQAFFREV